MKRALGQLSQLGVINQDDAARWIDGITRFHATRAVWHARRIYGIGGSEMGAVVSFFRGERHTGFTSVTEIVEGKLMKRLPSFETFHMRRGTALEDLARQVYLKKHGAVIDHTAMAALACARKRAGYEFMVGNPDDIVIRNGRRYVTDYKVPNTFSENIDFDYDVQLHHYATLANIAGIRIDGLELVKLDIPSEMAEHLTQNIASFSQERVSDIAASIAAMDTPGCRIVAIPVELKRSLQSEILAAGKDCWNEFVLKGIVPRFAQRGKLELDEATELRVAQYQQQYIMAKSGITYLDSVAKKAQAGINDALAEVDFEGKALPLSVVTVRPNKLDADKVIIEAKRLGATPEELQAEKRSYSIAALVSELSLRGADVDSPHLYEQTMDLAKAEAYLQDRGIDTKLLRKEGVVVELARQKEAKEFGKVFQESAAERFGAWIEDSMISVEDDPEFQSEEPVDQPYMPIEMETGHLSEAFVQAFEPAPVNENPTQNPMRAVHGLR